MGVAGWDLGDLLPRWFCHVAEELAPFHEGFSRELLGLPHNTAAAFQETGSRSCQSFEAGASKLAQCPFCHISAYQQPSRLSRCKGEAHRLRLSLFI